MLELSGLRRLNSPSADNVQRDRQTSRLNVGNITKLMEFIEFIEMAEDFRANLNRAREHLNLSRPKSNLTRLNSSESQRNRIDIE